jgi:hypothetical protein
MHFSNCFNSILVFVMFRTSCVNNQEHYIVQSPAEIPEDLVTQLSGNVGVWNLSLSALLAKHKASQSSRSAGL